MAKKLPRVPPLTFVLNYSQPGCVEWQAVEFPEIHIRVHTDEKITFRQVLLQGDDQKFDSVKAAYRELMNRKKRAPRKLRKAVRKVQKKSQSKR